MNFISTLAIAMGASWVSGINLYTAVATLGLLSRFSSLKLPGELEVLTNWWVIGIALFLFVVEFIADKIQVVDSVWDVIHPFIRIPAGAVLAATAFGDDGCRPTRANVALPPMRTTTTPAAINLRILIPTLFEIMKPDW